MRIDKIIDRISKTIFPWSLIPHILSGSIPLSLRIFVWLIHLKRKYLVRKKGSFKWLYNIEDIKEYNIPASALDPKTKKMGISALARLKNAEEFLETCVGELLPLIDEMILLVDINSSDKTEEICQSLSKKHPKKCKFFKYAPEVYPWNHPKYSSTPDNSVHALSYFYNYCLSKASYRYVMKFDDDMLVIPENFKEMIDHIHREQPMEMMLALPQINVSLDANGEYAIATKYLQSGIAALFWDHGIFPISEETYFYNDTGCENIIMPHKIKYGKISFLHLKNLKSDQGLKNYTGYGKKYVEDLQRGTEYISLPKKYRDTIKNALWDSKPIL